MGSSCCHSTPLRCFFSCLVLWLPTEEFGKLQFSENPLRLTDAIRKGLCVTCKDLERFLCVCVCVCVCLSAAAMLVLVSGHPSWDLYSLPLMLTPYVMYSVYLHTATERQADISVLSHAEVILCYLYGFINLQAFLWMKPLKGKYLGKQDFFPMLSNPLEQPLIKSRK